MRYVKYSDLSDKQKRIYNCEQHEFIAPRHCGKTTAVFSGAVSKCCENSGYKVCVVKRGPINIGLYLNYISSQKEYKDRILLDQTVIVFFKNRSVLVLTELCGEYGIMCVDNNVTKLKNWTYKKYIDMNLFYDIIYFDDVHPSNVYKGSKEYLFDILSYYVKDRFTFVYTNPKCENCKPNFRVVNRNLCDPYYPNWFSKNAGPVINTSVEQYAYLYQYGKYVEEGVLGTIIYEDKDGICAFQDEYGNVWLIEKAGLEFVDK